jgi:hypothetical protein
VQLPSLLLFGLLVYLQKLSNNFPRKQKIFFTMVSLIALLLACVPLAVNAQSSLSQLIGTWSSGPMKVQTGSGFANPANTSFIYPATSGISYSFAVANANGEAWYEIARFRFTSNGSDPKCITAVMNWVHGTYALQSNGSIVLTPNGDGYQQIQDPCAAQSNFVQNYNDTELLVAGWYTYNDPQLGLALQLFQFDGSPLAPQYQVSSTPNMLPTQQLRNVTAPTTVLSRRGNGAAQAHGILGDWTLTSTAVTIVFAVVASVL